MQQQIDRHGQRRRHQQREEDCRERIDAIGLRQHEQRIAGGAHEGVLADRDQARVTGEQVPHLGHRDIAAQSPIDRIVPGRAHHGMTASRSAASTASVIAMRPDTVWRWTWTSGIAASESAMRSWSCPSEQALRARRQHGQENDVAGQHAEAGINAEADRLGDAEHHGADKGAPDRSHAADDYGLEGVDELGGSVGGATVERSAWKTAAKPRMPTAIAVAIA